MAVVELSRLLRSEIIARTTDDRLPMSRTPSIKHVQRYGSGIFSAGTQKHSFVIGDHNAADAEICMRLKRKHLRFDGP